MALGVTTSKHVINKEHKAREKIHLGGYFGLDWLKTDKSFPNACGFEP